MLQSAGNSRRSSAPRRSLTSSGGRRSTSEASFPEACDKLGDAALRELIRYGIVQRGELRRRG